MLRARAVHRTSPTVALSYVDGFQQEESDGDCQWIWATEAAVLRLVDPERHNVAVRLEGELLTHSDRSPRVRLTAAGKSIHDGKVRPGGDRVLDPGRGVARCHRRAGEDQLADDRPPPRPVGSAPRLPRLPLRAGRRRRSARQIRTRWLRRRRHGRTVRLRHHTTHSADPCRQHSSRSSPTGGARRRGAEGHGSRERRVLDAAQVEPSYRWNAIRRPRRSVNLIRGLRWVRPSGAADPRPVSPTTRERGASRGSGHQSSVEERTADTGGRRRDEHAGGFRLGRNGRDPRRSSFGRTVVDDVDPDDGRTDRATRRGTGARRRVADDDTTGSRRRSNPELVPAYRARHRRADGDRERGDRRRGRQHRSRNECRGDCGDVHRRSVHRPVLGQHGTGRCRRRGHGGRRVIDEILKGAVVGVHGASWTPHRSPSSAQTDGVVTLGTRSDSCNCQAPRAAPRGVSTGSTSGPKPAELLVLVLRHRVRSRRLRIDSGINLTPQRLRGTHRGWR